MAYFTESLIVLILPSQETKNVLLYQCCGNADNDTTLYNNTQNLTQ